MLFNESFAGTNEHEGSEIGYQVVRALLEARSRCSSSPTGTSSPTASAASTRTATLFLRADRQPDGSRAYKLTVNDPLPTSFGEDLYYRLGGWLEEDKTLTPAASEAIRDGELHP